MKLVPQSEAAALIACVLAAAEVSDRLRDNDPAPRPGWRPPHPDPAKRRNSPQRVYGLTAEELPEWRWLMAHKNLRAIEAANVILADRRARDRGTR